MDKAESLPYTCLGPGPLPVIPTISTLRYLYNIILRIRAQRILYTDNITFEEILIRNRFEFALFNTDKWNKA